MILKFKIWYLFTILNVKLILKQNLYQKLLSLIRFKKLIKCLNNEYF